MANIPPISFALDDYIDAKRRCDDWGMSEKLAIGMGNPIGLSRTRNPRTWYTVNDELLDAIPLPYLAWGISHQRWAQ